MSYIENHMPPDIFLDYFLCQSICKLAWTIMVIHFASMHNSKHRLFFQNAQFSKPSKLRGMMPRKVNYSMHFACTHYNIGVIGLILDEDFQVIIVIGTNKNPITKDLSNNFLIFIISFSTVGFLCHLLCLPNRALHYICPLNRNQTPIST